MIYKLINIPDLSRIQRELIVNMPYYFTNVETRFHGIVTTKIKNYCPLLYSFLKDLNLEHRWTGTGISVLNNNQLAIHTDSQDVNRIYALNIPISNCENSYTVWYKPDVDYDPVFEHYESNGKKVTYKRYDDTKMTEITRLDSNLPAIVNVKIPHRGVSYNTERRFLLSLRFTPNLNEHDINLFN